jgi:hypothetical protein
MVSNTTLCFLSTNPPSLRNDSPTSTVISNLSYSTANYTGGSSKEIFRSNPAEVHSGQDSRGARRFCRLKSFTAAAGCGAAAAVVKITQLGPAYFSSIPRKSGAASKMHFA